MLAQLSVLQSITRPGAGETLSQADLAALREGLSALEQMAREMLYEARAVEDTHSLESLPDMPLAEALARAVDETAETMQLSSRVVFSGEEHPLSKEIEGLLYHSALAALSQVRQHSGARKLRFTMQYENDRLVMSIEDDGVPIPGVVPGLFEDDAQALPVPPFTTKEDRQSPGPDDALFARLRNRAEMFGGSLEVMASIEHGTQVQVRLPYKQQTRIREEPVMEVVQGVSTKPVRILVVDSLAVTRAGLRRLLENYSDLLVIGEAADGVRSCPAVKAWKRCARSSCLTQRRVCCCFPRLSAKNTCMRRCGRELMAMFSRIFSQKNWRRRCAVLRAVTCWCNRRLPVA
jgi:hypothetical protein